MIKQISVLSLGGFIATLLQILLYPIFASRTGSELLGDYGYIISLVQAGSLAILLNTQLLIRVETDQKAIDKVINLGFTLLLLFSVPIGLCFFNYSIAIKFTGALTFILIGTKHLSLSVLYNEEKYIIISIINILTKIIGLSLLICATYLLKVNLLHLLLIFLISETIILLVIFSSISKKIFIPQVSLNFDTLVQYKDLVAYKSAQDIVNRLGGQLPIIFARNFIDSATAGNYFLALKIVQSPLSILSKSIRDVVFVEYGKLKASFNRKFATHFVLGHLLVFLLIYLLFSLCIMLQRPWF